MTKIIKIADNHYRYGDIDMEIVEDDESCCDGCPLTHDKCCVGDADTYNNCMELIGQKHFRSKENKMTETSKIFTIDNGDKQFKAKLWLEERNVCFQVIRNEGELNDTNNVNATCMNTELGSEEVSANNLGDSEICNEYFASNAARNAYYKKACGWLQEFVDVNSVVDKFDVYDVYTSEVGQTFCYQDKHKKNHQLFTFGMAQDNFAGIKYKGNEGWFMDRKVLIGDKHLSGCMASHETDIITRATPEKIRFFKAVK